MAAVNGNLQVIQLVEELAAKAREVTSLYHEHAPDKCPKLLEELMQGRIRELEREIKGRLV